MSKSFYTFEVENGEVILTKEDFPLFTAVIAEPIQGEGGVREISSFNLNNLRVVCDELNIPLIFDEIQSGMGRTGTFFASQNSEVVADVYLIGKSIGGGIAKNSCVFFKKNDYEEPFGTIHTSTFAEDGLSAAIGLKAIELLERNDGEAYRLATEKGNKLIEGFNVLKERYPDVIKEVRGRGLLIGVEFFDDPDSDCPVQRNATYWNNLNYILFSFLQEAYGIRALPTSSAPSTLRIEPGINFTDQEIERTLSAFDDLCRIISNADSYHLLHHMTTRDRGSRDKQIKNFNVGKNSKKAALVHSRKKVPKVAFIAHIVSPENIVASTNSFKAKYSC